MRRSGVEQFHSTRAAKTRKIKIDEVFLPSPWQATNPAQVSMADGCLGIPEDGSSDVSVQILSPGS